MSNPGHAGGGNDDADDDDGMVKNIATVEDGSDTSGLQNDQLE